MSVQCQFCGVIGTDEACMIGHEMNCSKREAPAGAFERLVACADAVRAVQLRQQARRASEDVKKWPKWMQEAASAPVLRCCSCGTPITVQEGYEGDTCKACLFG